MQGSEGKEGKYDKKTDGNYINSEKENTERIIKFD